MRLNIGFTSLKNNKLADRADAIVAALTGNAHFPTPAPSLAQITTATANLRTAVAMPAGPARGPAIEVARGALIALLQSLGQNLDSTSGATPATLATTGFALPKTPTRASAPPAAPGDLRLAHGPNPGEIVGKCRAAAGTRSLEGEWTLDPNAGPWNDGGSFPNGIKMLFSGLPRGKDVWVHVRALGTAGTGPWSDPATIMVT